MALTELARVQLELDEEWYTLDRLATFNDEQKMELRVFGNRLRALLDLPPLYQDDRWRKRKAAKAAAKDKPRENVPVWT